MSADTGAPIILIWPRGYAAWLVQGRAEIVAPDGKAIRQSGDGVVLSGLGGGSVDSISSGPGFGICEVDD